MIDDQYHNYLQPGSFIFFDLDGSKVPFRITGFEESLHKIVSLDGIQGKQESDAISGLNIWIPIELVKAKHLKSPKSLEQQWDDYHILDEKTNATYRIKRTEEYPQQLMAVIEHDGKEVLIPMHEQLIVDIERKSKVIRMNIPEGLLSL